MKLWVRDDRGALIADVDVQPDCPFAREPGEASGFVFGTFTMGPAFADVQARLDVFNWVYATGNLAEASALHEEIDGMNMVAIDHRGQVYSVFNVYFVQGGHLFSAIRAGRGSNLSGVLTSNKLYRLSPTQLTSIAPGRGSCMASDMILVDGKRVAYMYREPPDSDHDSGWRFFSGEESQAYSDDPEHFALYDVNTVANYDPSIVAWLDEPVGSAFERDESGAFIEIPFPSDPDDE